MVGILVTTSIASASEIVLNRLVLRSVRWREGTTAGHKCIITDGANNVLWTSVAAGANYVEESDLSRKHGVVTGLKVSTLGSGSVDIYYHR